MVKSCCQNRQYFAVLRIRSIFSNPDPGKSSFKIRIWIQVTQKDRIRIRNTGISSICSKECNNY